MSRQLASLSTKKASTWGSRQRKGWEEEHNLYGGLFFIMLQGSTSGRTIYYRGYVIQETGQTIYCSISGLRPGRQELAISETSQEAMRWIDQRVALSKATEPMYAASYAQQASWQFFGAAYTPVFG